MDDLAWLVALAQSRGASRLLILSGKPLVARKNGELTPPLLPSRVHFSQVERLVSALLTQQQHDALNRDGELELVHDFRGRPCPVTVFYGDGAHNIIIHLEQN